MFDPYACVTAIWPDQCLTSEAIALQCPVPMPPVPMMPMRIVSPDLGGLTRLPALLQVDPKSAQATPLSKGAKPRL